MKVLIIDDHDMNVTLLKNLMMAKVPDCETCCYTESAEALAWCEENDPDLVLVDYMMPSPNGLEFIERFRKLPGKRDIPVVMITAVNEKDIRLKAIEYGANDFINKPIDTAELTARVKNMLALRKSQKALANRAEWLAEEVRKATREIVEREREVILRLTRAAEYRDPETGMHIVRMAQYCKLIAKAIGLSEDEQDLILDASPMHDIGKVGIADFILLKGEHLSTDEFESMKKHTFMGFEILQGSKSKLLQMAERIALYHHEKFDGTGYPYGIRDYDIPLAARICALSDVFDALMSRRPYKEPWTLDDTMNEINKRIGTHFDPDLVKAFKAVLPDILEVQKRFTYE
ncbi:response regulator [bacterium]|nr:response regulator [bacterium]